MSWHCPVAARACGMGVRDPAGQLSRETSPHQVGGAGVWWWGKQISWFATYLKGRQALRPLVKVHMSHADANGTGRDDDDLVAIFAELDRRLHHHREDGQVRLAGLLVDDGARAWGWRVSAWSRAGRARMRGFRGVDSPSLMTMVCPRGPFMAAERGVWLDGGRVVK